jgi:glycosyltransferase involved in cell wall biosynthesis
VKVSFVIPSYQQGMFLRRCIDGCLAQGLPGAEVIVVDGGSTDGSREILVGYAERIRWSSEPDGGQAEAVNKGVARATGEVIAWINSDDCYADAGAVGRTLAAFGAGADLVYGDALLVDAAGTAIRPYVTRDFASPRDLLLAPQGPSQPATFFRRDLFLQAGGLRTDLRYALDYELWLRLFERARAVRRIPGVLAHMTAHPAAKSIHSMGAHIDETVRVKREAAARLGLGLLDRARLTAGAARLRAYHLAVRAGLRRAT